VTRLSREESRAYFDSRPLGSRIGALASRQSSVIPDRSHLEAAFAEQYARYGADPEARVPIPEWWGGYRVEPRSIEFWQGRPSRLHDRLRYVRQPDGTWQIQRLAP
jgi:pyridoxamine 5'-phosphate oxidase